MSPVKRLAEQIPEIDSWVGRGIIGLIALLLSLSLWVQKSMYDELVSHRNLLKSLEVGQAEMAVKIDGNSELKKELAEIRLQVRELERDILRKTAGGSSTDR